MDMPVKTTESLDLFINATQQFERALTWIDGIKEGIMAFLIIIMMPLATTEIGTDGWIGGLMEEPMKEAGYNAG